MRDPDDTGKPRIPPPLLTEPRSENIVLTAFGSAKLAHISSRDGSVRINWDLIERLAATPEITESHMLAFALVMLAIRDGTWLPMDHPGPRLS